MRAECLRNVFGANSSYDIKYILAPKINKRKYFLSLTLKSNLPNHEEKI